MGNTWEKLVHNVIKIHGYDIINKLINKNTAIIPTPDHTKDALDERQLATEKRDQ